MYFELMCHRHSIFCIYLECLVCMYVKLFEIKNNLIYTD